MAEQQAHCATALRAEPTCDKINAKGGRRGGAAFVESAIGATHEPAQQRFGRKQRVGSGHGIAAQAEAIGSGASDEAMQEQAAISPGEHDLAGLEIFERATGDLDHVARPKSGQHTFAVNAQTHAAAELQCICQQSGSFRTPTRGRATRLSCKHQEVFFTW
jgi:hypothetical protein